MALTRLYFGTDQAGDFTGSSWANRGIFATAGTINSIITNFAFNSTDRLEVMLGPGTHTISSVIASGLWANPPSVPNQFSIHGCDSSGVALTPPDPNWTSNMPAWSDTGLPVIATTTNIASWGLVNGMCRLIKFTASGRTSTGGVISGCADWCHIVTSSSGTSAQGHSGSTRLSNCVVIMTGASFDAAGIGGSYPIVNTRYDGSGGGATSGDRDGVKYNTSTSLPYLFYGNTIVGFTGYGIEVEHTSANQWLHFSRCTIVANDGGGIALNGSTASTGVYVIEGCQITDNGGYGFDASTGVDSYGWLRDCRARDNTSGDFTGLSNYEAINCNTESVLTAATEYVSATVSPRSGSGAGDYRIINTASTYGYGYGVADGPPASSGGGSTEGIWRGMSPAMG